MSVHSIQDKIINCLTQQISEFELLRSMYPNSNEILLTDSKIIDEINNYIENKSDYTPSQLDFVIKLHLNDLKLEVFVNLPNFYPEEGPDIYVRCNQLNRQQETDLNTELSKYIKNEYSGEVCLYTAILWLQENIEMFSKKNDYETEIEVNNHSTDKFVRQWIYSHHIYNKKKRDEILKKARELGLTGFCVPGKPGIICIEGPDSDCNEWWRDIKSMCWQKIVIRKTETFEFSEQKVNQKFSTFDEIHFKNPTSRSGKHADMSQFSKYMEKYGLSKTFNEFFGLCNNA